MLQIPAVELRAELQKKKKKKDSFILSFFSNETVSFSHLFCGWFW